MRGPRGAARGGSGGGRPIAAATFRVRVTPRSSRDGIAGISEGVLRVRLTAPPVENRANEALAAFLAGLLGVPRGRVAIVAGATGRTKTVRVEGVPAAEVLRRLGLPADGAS